MGGTTCKLLSQFADRITRYTRGCGKQITAIVKRERIACDIIALKRLIDLIVWHRERWIIQYY